MSEGLWPLRVPLLGDPTRQRSARHNAARVSLVIVLVMCLVAAQPVWRMDMLRLSAILSLFSGGDYNACGRARLVISIQEHVIDCDAIFSQLLSPDGLNLEQPPHITFPGAEDRGFYALAVIDLDAPNPDAPSEREYRHWLVGNLLGVEIKVGNVTQFHELTPWQPPTIESGSSQHRVIFLLFSEYGPSVTFEPIPEVRHNWNAQKWADSYGFGPPVASTCFLLG